MTFQWLSKRFCCKRKVSMECKINDLLCVWLHQSSNKVNIPYIRSCVCTGQLHTTVVKSDPSSIHRFVYPSRIRVYREKRQTIFIKSIQLPKHSHKKPPSTSTSCTCVCTVQYYSRTVRTVGESVSQSIWISIIWFAFFPGMSECHIWSHQSQCHFLYMMIVGQ